jgi:hypothetical protein
VDHAPTCFRKMKVFLPDSEADPRFILHKPSLLESEAHINLHLGCFGSPHLPSPMSWKILELAVTTLITHFNEF